MALSCAFANSSRLLCARSLSFKSRMSPLNPSIAKVFASSAANNTLKTKSIAITSTEERINTRKHLDNLERLLNKQPMDVVEPKQQPQVEVSREGLGERRGKGLLEGLNLGRIWPEMKAAEEMSPRHLNRLQRLLSMTMEYSPRNVLGGKWREYHGSNNWEGMLDPLDENLRREVVRYGEFIQAAYQAFNSNPTMPIDEAPHPQHVTLSDKAYKVTKGLYATSSIGLPEWVDDVAPDLGWMTQRSSWIGYVAVCDDRHEIQRMGRRDIVIALRGTTTCLEWAENMRAQMVSIDPTQEEEQAKVECGFSSLYKTPGAHVPSLAESVTQEVKRLIELYKGETLSITITGHSLGAALALLVADEISTCAKDVPPVAVFSFGGPRVGNNAFVSRMENKNVKVLRIVNNQDLITKVPGVFISEFLEQKLRETIVDDSMPWNYHHVGTELRLDTRMSPFLKPNPDVACCHDLEAYLHLVDGYLASDCPFRANAKRSLVKLLQEQGSNVKKLYTSKAKALTLNLERDRMQPIPVSTCLPSPSSS